MQCKPKRNDDVPIIQELPGRIRKVIVRGAVTGVRVSESGYNAGESEARSVWLRKTRYVSHNTTSGTAYWILYTVGYVHGCVPETGHKTEESAPWVIYKLVQRSLWGRRGQWVGNLHTRAPEPGPLVREGLAARGAGVSGVPRSEEVCTCGGLWQKVAEGPVVNFKGCGVGGPRVCHLQVIVFGSPGMLL